MHKIFSTCLIGVLLFSTISTSFAVVDTCQYKAQFDECIEANKVGNPWGIDAEEFVCISSSDDEQILYNIILDQKFKIIDQEADEYLQSLSNQKDYYFGINRQKNFLEAVDDIEANFGKNGIFDQRYYQECDGGNLDGILSKTVECLGKKTTVIQAQNFMTSTLCGSLYEHKNEIRKKSAYYILKLNKQEVRRNEKKRYEQIQRSFYGVLIDAFVVNMGYLLRMSQKWASKTKNPY